MQTHLFRVLLAVALQLLQAVAGVSCMLLKGLESEARSPALLAEVQQHALFKLVLAVVNQKRIVVPVEAMDESLNQNIFRVPQSTWQKL